MAVFCDKIPHMIITCPSCHRKYSVDSAKLASAKKVRCTVCQATWDCSKEASGLLDTPINLNKGYNRPMPYNTEPAATNFWPCLGSVLLLFTLMLGFFVCRDQLATYIPHSRLLYEGLNLNYRLLDTPIEVANVSYATANGRVRLSGDLLNRSNMEEIIPALSIDVIVDGGKKAHFEYKLPQDRIFAKAGTHFVTDWYKAEYKKFSIRVCLKK